MKKYKMTLFYVALALLNIPVMIAGVGIGFVVFSFCSCAALICYSGESV